MNDNLDKSKGGSLKITLLMFFMSSQSTKNTKIIIHIWNYFGATTFTRTFFLLQYDISEPIVIFQFLCAFIVW